MKIQAPWMGRIRGSAGNMTGCKIYDKNVMRAKAFEVNNPNTAAQQVQRSYFADLTKLVASFTPEQLRTLFPSKPKAMSRRNALAKQLAEYNTMSGTEKVVDFADIDTLGNASTMNFGNLQCFNDEDQWDVELDASLPSNTEISDNYFIVVLVNETQGKISFTNESALVSDASLMLSNPSGWQSTDTVHAIPLITNAKTALTDFGSFIIKVRPEKKSN